MNTNHLMKHTKPPFAILVLTFGVLFNALNVHAQNAVLFSEGFETGLSRWTGFNGGFFPAVLLHQILLVPAHKSCHSAAPAIMAIYLPFHLSAFQERRPLKFVSIIWGKP